MIYYKSSAEIAAIREGGRRLAAILSRLVAATVPGKMTGDLESLACQLIEECGGRPSFLDYPMGGGIIFPSALCVSINDEVVHGSSLPSRRIEEGDIVDLDIGMEWPVRDDLRESFGLPRNPHSSSGGFFTDTCRTVGVGHISPAAKNLLEATEEALQAAIMAARPGNTMNDIARAVEKEAKKHSYGIVRDLVGHGVGYFAHEEPDVFNFTIRDNSPENIILKPGLVIAIEPMINAGDWPVRVADNGYTILTADGSLSAHFEHTVAITDKGAEIFTKYE